MTVEQASKLVGCSPQYMRMAFQQQRVFPFGGAIKTKGKSWRYFVSDERLAQYLGISTEELKERASNEEKSS